MQTMDTGYLEIKALKAICYIAMRVFVLRHMMEKIMVLTVQFGLCVKKY